MSAKPIKKPKSKGTDWARIDAQTDDDISYEDHPELGPEFWENAVPFVPPKKAVSIRLDQDVIAWFKKRGKRYQTAINGVLRAFMLASQQQADRPKKKK